MTSLTGITVLAVDDSPTQCAQLRFTLEEAGYEVVTATNGQDALAAARAMRVDIVVSDVVMPGLDGFGLCEAIRGDHRIGDLPVVLLTAMTDPMDVLRALEVGADGFVRKPYDPPQLVARVQAVLASAQRRMRHHHEAGVNVRLGDHDHYLTQERLQLLDALAPSHSDMLGILSAADQRTDPRIRVLVAEDSRTERAWLQFVLEEAGAAVVAVTNGAEALAALEGSSFDVVITDAEMPETDGYTFCRAIRLDPRWCRLPVLMVTSRAGSDDVHVALDAGVTGLIAKPVDEARLVDRVRSLFAGHAGRLPRPSAAPIDLAYGGRHFLIAADRIQMLDLLVASYDHTVQQNEDLRNVRDQLQELNLSLEERVAERTAEVVRQVEERTRADQRRAEVEAQLRASQRAESLGALVGGVAHDFNNLLSVIIGFTEMAQDGVTRGSQAWDDLQEAVGAADRAAALTSQLLAFSRKQVLNPVPLDLNNVIRNLTGMLRRIVGEDIRVMEQLAPGLALVRADPSQIQQVIMNIVVNARDAMPSGGILTIETSNVDAGQDGALSAAVEGPCVMVALRDTGTGMDRETMDRIFEPFYTTKEVGKGTGLGMATVHGIVRQSGGDILVQSELGVGTTLRILLPKLDAAEAEAEQAVAPRVEAGGTETILLVEDEPSVRSLTARMLESAGYTVLATGGGEEALDVCRRNRGGIDMLLTDVVMPGLSGPEVAERVAEGCPSAVILFMSGYAEERVARHGLRDRHGPLLTKPFSRDRLLEMVRTTLDERSPGDDPA